MQPEPKTFIFALIFPVLTFQKKYQERKERVGGKKLPSSQLPVENTEHK